MVVLQIEHPVADFTKWKAAFDNDPLKRKESGVLRYRIYKTVHNPEYIIIDLEFNALKEATAMHDSLKQLWKKVEGRVIMNPQSRVVELVESLEYQ